MFECPRATMLAEADLLRRLQRIAEHDIGLARCLVVFRRHEIRLVEEDGVDLVLADELDEVDRALGLELDLVDLLVGEEDILALLDLVALDDVRGSTAPTAGHHLLVADALAARLVDLVEADPAADLVAGNTWTGIETSASLIWPCQYARAAIPFSS